MFVCSNGYIYFSKYVSDGRAKASTGIKVPKVLPGQPQQKGFNYGALKKSDQFVLDRIKASVTRFEESSRLAGNPLLKSETEGVVIEAIGRTRKRLPGFIGDFKKVIADMRSGVLLKRKSNERYSDGTATLFEQCLTCLQKFSAQTGTPLNYNIDSKWFQSLMKWFIDNDYAKNSIATIGGNFRNFLRITYGTKHRNLFFKSEEFSFSQEETDSVVPTEEELKKIYSLNLSKAQTRARDVFVFGCYVGLRSKDLRRINEYKIRGNLIEVLTDKTGKKVVIPLHPVAREIIEKYGEGNMPVLRPNCFNVLLEKICKAAEMNEEYLITMTKGGKRTGVYYKKYQLISRHTSRRYFATHAYKAGIPTKRIMLITAHTTEAAFFRYIKIEQEDNAQELLEHPYFKPDSACKLTSKRLLRLNKHRKKIVPGEAC